jgi:hypothetical protein
MFGQSLAGSVAKGLLIRRLSLSERGKVYSNTYVPWRSSTVLFKRLKEEMIRLKDEGRVLMRFNEVRDALRLRLTGGDSPFKDEELKAMVGLLAGPGVVWELSFGSWVLLQPERINA